VPNFYVVLALYFLLPGFRGDARWLPLRDDVSFTQNYHLEPGTAFSHAWSLCIEEQFYMLLPAAALGLARDRPCARRRDAGARLGVERRRRSRSALAP
jgi:peptidoglycan/LPS O-acetylase OafA/YrhL